MDQGRRDLERVIDRLTYRQCAVTLDALADRDPFDELKRDEMEPGILTNRIHPGNVFVIEPSGGWRFKDEEWLPRWIELGRWTEAEVAAIRAEGDRIAAELDAGRRWWSEDWADWQPDPAWHGGDLPAGWEDA